MGKVISIRQLARMNFGNKRVVLAGGSFDILHAGHVRYLEKAKKLGATIKMPATNVADYGRFAVLQDPTGAHIAIWQSLKNC